MTYPSKDEEDTAGFLRIREPLYQMTLIKHHCPQFHTHQLLLNDIMEGAEMRRGAPCWYKHPEVGLSAINDAALIQAAMFSTLKRHFNNKFFYKSVLETFNEVC